MDSTDLRNQKFPLDFLIVYYWRCPAIIEHCCCSSEISSLEMEGQYIYGQSNGKPTFFSVETGQRFSVEDKGEWISGWKNGRQCWFNTETKETRFSSPGEIQKCENDVLPTAIQITDEELLSIMDIDFDEPKSKKRKVNIDEEEKKKRDRANARKYRQRNKKKFEENQIRVTELEASIIEYRNALTVRDEKIKLLENRLAFLESIVTSEMMRRN